MRDFMHPNGGGDMNDFDEEEEEGYNGQELEEGEINP